MHQNLHFIQNPKCQVVFETANDPNLLIKGKYSFATDFITEF